MPPKPRRPLDTLRVLILGVTLLAGVAVMSAVMIGFGFTELSENVRSTAASTIHDVVLIAIGAFGGAQASGKQSGPTDTDES